jgi:ATP-dependent DNA ligase
MKYTGKYIYPPRPKNTIHDSELDIYEGQNMTAQIKTNGSNCVLSTNGIDYRVMNRHGQRMTNFRLTYDEIKDIYQGTGEWMMINAEYLNKNKYDEKNQKFNHKLIIFDILVYNNEYLVGSTFEQRINLLDKIYGQVNSEKDYLYRISENVYRVKSYDVGFKSLFDKYTPIDLVEGLVLKRKNSKLEISSGAENNWRGQVKSRKPTKNYKY